jgi:hypothetical protein
MFRNKAVGRSTPVTDVNIKRLQNINHRVSFKNSKPWYNFRVCHWAYERVNDECKHFSSQISGNPDLFHFFFILLSVLMKTK